MSYFISFFQDILLENKMSKNPYKICHVWAHIENYTEINGLLRVMIHKEKLAHET